MNGPIPDVGIEGPCPCRPDCDAGGEASLRNQKNRNGGESGEEAVDRKQNPGRSVRVDAEDLEDSANQIGIQWRLPGAGAGVPSVRIAEALTQGEGAADAPHLKAEAEVIFSGAGMVLAKGSNSGHLPKKRQ